MEVREQSDVTEVREHKDATAIREVFNKMTIAWNRQDLNLFASLFAPDVNYITFMGEHISGLGANIRMHRQLWSNSFMKGATLEGEIVDIKFTDEGTAVMIANGGVKLRFHKKMPASRFSINTTVLVKQNGEWKISSFQNTRITGFSLFMRLVMWFGKKIK